MNTQIAKDKKSVIILILVGLHKVPFLLEPPTYTAPAFLHRLDTIPAFLHMRSVSVY